MVGPFSSRRQAVHPSLASTGRNRCGLAVTELAVGLPVLLIMLLGTMEICTMIRLRQKLNMIAYETARVGVLPNTKQKEVQYQCQLLCEDQQLNTISLETTPADPRQLRSGEWFTVHLSAPFTDNALMGNWKFNQWNLSESVTLQKP